MATDMTALVDSMDELLLSPHHLATSQAVHSRGALNQENAPESQEFYPITKSNESSRPKA